VARFRRLELKNAEVTVEGRQGTIVDFGYDPITGGPLVIVDVGDELIPLSLYDAVRQVANRGVYGPEPVQFRY